MILLFNPADLKTYCCSRICKSEIDWMDELMIFETKYLISNFLSNFVYSSPIFRIKNAIRKDSLELVRCFRK